MGAAYISPDKERPGTEGCLKSLDNENRNETSITHKGVTYFITEFAHYSETPLETCPDCGGSGQLYTRKCRNCKGRGLIIAERKPITGKVPGQ